MVYFYPKTEKFQKKIYQDIGNIIYISQKSKPSAGVSVGFRRGAFDPPDMKYYVGEELAFRSI